MFAAIDVLTCWQRGRPTAALVRRKVQCALARLGGDEEVLCFLLHSVMVKACLWFGPYDVDGVACAVQSFLADVAEEIEHVHARPPP